MRLPERRVERRGRNAVRSTRQHPAPEEDTTIATTQSDGVSYNRPDLELGPESPTGCLILLWLDDPSAAEESPDLPCAA